VVHVEDVRGTLLSFSGESPGGYLGQSPRHELPRGDKVEPELEFRLWCDAQRDPAHVAVRVAVGDERKGDAAKPFHLHGRREARTTFGEDPRERPGEGEVVRPLAARSPERRRRERALRREPG